jgi:hypothetical protein
MYIEIVCILVWTTGLHGAVSQKKAPSSFKLFEICLDFMSMN